ncbi:MAG: hypothetical protein SPI18_04900 [Prevotella sp.]|nr:hypothetical protein [Prevotella sp.]MDY6130603.1 hypothetical protein [Prevotella sp.]
MPQRTVVCLPTDDLFDFTRTSVAVQRIIPRYPSDDSLNSTPTTDSRLPSARM